jgi:elongation factor P
MAVLDYNEIKEGVVIVHGGEPYLVVSNHVAKKSMGKPSNQVKLKSLINGRTIEQTFHAAETAVEADISKKEIKYLYKTPKGEYWFCDVLNPKNRFTLSDDLLGNKMNYLLANSVVTAKIFGEDEEERIIGLVMPVKVDLKIIDCPPSVRGDTATGGNKIVTVETGAKVNVPLFMSNGEIIRINTDNGEYVERVR